jgi:NAD(P)-dependent dehydrogenase (short-subunit alcohol dehydrogenase family)
MRPEQTVAIVTGGGRGIGAATARGLASDGVDVVLVARSEAETSAVAAGIRDAGGGALALAADVSEDGAADIITRTAEEHFGRPCQILVNAAGITGPVAELAELDLASFRRVIEINLTGGLRLAPGQMRSLEPTGVGAGVIQMLADIERGPGLVKEADSARLIRLAATGQADDLAGTAFSIYDPGIRARITSAP